MQKTKYKEVIRETLIPKWLIPNSKVATLSEIDDFYGLRKIKRKKNRKNKLSCAIYHIQKRRKIATNFRYPLKWEEKKKNKGQGK